MAEISFGAPFVYIELAFGKDIYEWHLCLDGHANVRLLWFFMLYLAILELPYA
jgi:hypothetical protein